MNVMQPNLPRDQVLREPLVGTHMHRHRVQVRVRSGIWEVRVDDKFCGDYYQKEHALAAALELSLR